MQGTLFAATLPSGPARVVRGLPGPLTRTFWPPRRDVRPPPARGTVQLVATATERGRLVKLRLVVHTDEAPAHDIEVEVEADGATPAAAVAEAFERELGVAANELVVTRSGRPLAEETPLRALRARARRRARSRRRPRTTLGVSSRRRDRRLRRTGHVGAPSASGGRARARARRLVRARRRRSRNCPRATSCSALRTAVTSTSWTRLSSNGTLVDGVSDRAGRARAPRAGPGRASRAHAPRARAAAATGGGLPAPAGDGTIPFNRPPRVYRPLERRRRPFPPPPADPIARACRWRPRCSRSLLGVALYLVTGYPTMLLFGLLSPVLAVGTYLEDRRSGRRGFSEATRSYRQRLAALRDELEQERERELRRRRALDAVRARARSARAPPRSGVVGAPAGRPGLPRAPARHGRRARNARGPARPRRRARSSAPRRKRLPRGTRPSPAAPVVAALAELGVARPLRAARAGRRARPLARRARRRRCTPRASSSSRPRSSDYGARRLAVAEVAAARAARRRRRSRPGSPRCTSRRASCVESVAELAAERRARRGVALRRVADTRAPRPSLLVVDERRRPRAVARRAGARGRAGDRDRRRLARPSATRPARRVPRDRRARPRRLPARLHRRARRRRA